MFRAIYNQPVRSRTTSKDFENFNKCKLYSTNIWTFSKFNSNFSEPLMKFPSKLWCFILTDLNVITLSLLLAVFLSFKYCALQQHTVLCFMKNLIMKIFINTENMLCLRIKRHNHHHLSIHGTFHNGLVAMLCLYLHDWSK